MSAAALFQPPPSPRKRHEVVCTKASGVSIPWATFDTFEEARVVAARLAEIGASGVFVREAAAP